jgi:hypothetical protein
MITPSPAEQHTHVTQASPWEEPILHRTYQIFLPRTARGLSRTPAPPTADEQLFVMQGFVLGILSMFCSFFPVCGLPIAISGLIIGCADRRAGHFYKITTLTILFSAIGLALTLINIIISISIYFSFYLWR